LLGPTGGKRAPTEVLGENGQKAAGAARGLVVRSLVRWQEARGRPRGRAEFLKKPLTRRFFPWDVGASPGRAIRAPRGDCRPPFLGCVVARRRRAWPGRQNQTHRGGEARQAFLSTRRSAVPVCSCKDRSGTGVRRRGGSPAKGRGGGAQRRPESPRRQGGSARWERHPGWVRPGRRPGAGGGDGGFGASCRFRGRVCTLGRPPRRRSVAPEPGGVTGGDKNWLRLGMGGRYRGADRARPGTPKLGPRGGLLHFGDPGARGVGGGPTGTARDESRGPRLSVGLGGAPPAPRGGVSKKNRPAEKRRVPRAVLPQFLWAWAPSPLARVFYLRGDWSQPWLKTSRWFASGWTGGVRCRGRTAGGAAEGHEQRTP